MTTVPLAWYEKHRTWLKILRLSPALWLAAYLAFSVIVGWPVNALVRRTLLAEFGCIATPPQTQLVEQTSLHGPGKASVGGKYLTSLSYDEIRGHYDLKMGERGWRFLETLRNTPSGPELAYCKGNYTARLYYYSPSVFDFTYELSLRSGIISECAMMKGGGIIYMSFTDSLFLLGSALSWMLYSLIMSWASWIMSEDGISEVLRKLRIRVGIWGVRILSPTWFLIGLAITLISGYKMAMFASHWALENLAFLQR